VPPPLARELRFRIGVALGRQARNQRASPRVDVLLYVKGELVPVGSSIRILNLNRTGFAVLSDTRFRSGQRVQIRLNGPGVPTVEAMAVAVHTQSRQTSPGVYMTGFVFQPQRPGTDGPEAAVRELLTAVAPLGFKI